jgi:hypothetical protein
MSTQPPHNLSEEEIRQIEAEMERITVDDVLLQTLVTLLNLAARKGGLAAPPGPERPAPDLGQMGQAIEGARAILPLVEKRHAEQLGPVRDTLSQLQMAFAQLKQGAGAAAEGEQPPAPEGEQPPPAAEKPEGPGPAQSSGRLWIPGQ